MWQKKKKMTLGWVVNGGRRHAEPQGDYVPSQLCYYVHTMLGPTDKPMTIILHVCLRRYSSYVRYAVGVQTLGSKELQSLNSARRALIFILVYLYTKFN